MNYIGRFRRPFLPSPAFVGAIHEWPARENGRFVKRPSDGIDIKGGNTHGKRRQDENAPDPGAAAKRD